MRLGLGVVAFSLVWGVTADGDPQRGGPANRGPRPTTQPRRAPAPSYPSNQPQPTQAPYDPYTDPRQPPPTPPPRYDPRQPPPAPSGYDPYADPRQPPPQPYYPGAPPPTPQPYYPSQPSAPSQPSWNPPPPVQQPQTWNPSPSPTTVPTPTPTPTIAQPMPVPPDQRQKNIELATPPAGRVPAPYVPPPAGVCSNGGYGGSTYGSAPVAMPLNWPAMPEAYVPPLEITNGCGPGDPSVDPAKYYDLDVSTYLDSNTPEIIGNDPRYVVNFRKACLMHDIGYSGAKSYDFYSGTVRDFFDDTRDQIDNRFYTDMVKECDSQIPATAAAARENCKSYGGYHMSHGARTRYQGVSKGGAMVGAWKDRPSLSGTWRVDGFATAGTWTITQNKRYVTARWNGGTSSPDLTGEFRGTLISHDAWHTIDGFYVLYDKGVPRCTPVPSSWRWEPGSRNKLTVNGPGSLTLVK